MRSSGVSAAAAQVPGARDAEPRGVRQALAHRERRPLPARLRPRRHPSRRVRIHTDIACGMLVCVGVCRPFEVR